MSTRTDTRTRILEAARELLERHGPHAAGMERIARAAGVTRQSVYLHFGSRARLLLALVAHVDAGRDVNRRVDELWALPDALAALDAVADLAAATNPEVHRIALALDAARRWDDAFGPAWEDRTRLRRRRYERLAGWLRREAVLGPGWAEEEAVAYLWTMTSVQTYDQLVAESGLPLTTYTDVLRASLRNALTSPLRGVRA